MKRKRPKDKRVGQNKINRLKKNSITGKGRQAQEQINKILIEAPVELKEYFDSLGENISLTAKLSKLREKVYKYKPRKKNEFVKKVVVFSKERKVKRFGDIVLNPDFGDWDAPYWFVEMRKMLKKKWKDIVKYRKRDAAGVFYVIRMYSKKETFIKLGITSTTVQSRYVDFDIYDTELLYSFIIPIKKLFDLETLCMKELYKHKLRYSPKRKMDGKTECFNIKALKILSVLKE